MIKKSKAQLRAIHAKRKLTQIEKSDRNFEESHGMRQGQVRENLIDGLKYQFQFLTDANQIRLKKMIGTKSWDDLSSLQAHELHKKVGSMARDDFKIINHRKYNRT